MAKLENLQVNIVQSLKSTMDAAVLLDSDSIARGVNQAFERLFGIREAEIVGKKPQEYIVSPELQEQSTQIRQKVMAGETVRLETERVHVDGRVIPVRISAYPVLEERNPLGILIVYVDLTERMIAETILQERRNQLQDFVDAVPDLSFIVDEDGKFLDVFGSVQKSLGKSRQELVDGYFHQLFPPAIADTFLEVTRNTINNGTPLYNIRENMMGTGRIVEERFIPLNYPVNNKKTLGVIITDITDRRRMEQMLNLAYEVQRRSDYINRVIFEGNPVNEAETFSARELGLDFAQPMFCCVLQSDAYANASTGADEYNKHRKLKYNLIEGLGNDPGNIVWDCRNEIGVLCKTTNPDGTKPDEAVIDRLKEKLLCFAPDTHVILGVGNPQTGPEGVRISFRQAWSGVLASYCQQPQEAAIQVFYYQKLGFLKFLINYSEEKYVAEFINETIGKVLQHDRRKGADLFGTLEAIIENFTLQAAAKSTYLHPKTVGYRKQRLEKILGYSLDTIDRRYAIALAISLYKIESKMDPNYLF